MVETFAALAEPNRLRIVELLRAGAQPVNAIGEALELRQPQVSKHLRVLKAAGLVGVEARAQQRLYGLRPEPLRALDRWLDDYRRLWAERLDQLDALVGELTAGQAEDLTAGQAEGLAAGQAEGPTAGQAGAGMEQDPSEEQA